MRRSVYGRDGPAIVLLFLVSLGLLSHLWGWDGMHASEAQSYVGAARWVAEGRDTYLSIWSPTTRAAGEPSLLLRSQGISRALMSFPDYASGVELWLDSKTNEQPIVLVVYETDPWPDTVDASYQPRKGRRLESISLFAAQRWYRLQIVPQQQHLLLEIEAGGSVGVYFSSFEGLVSHRPRFDVALPPTDPTVDPAIWPPGVGLSLPTRVPLAPLEGALLRRER